jgi:hypothetical protein
MGISSVRTTNLNSIKSSSFINATGGAITSYTSGGARYNVHSFTGSGSFQIISGSGTVDYLIVGGGGGGGGCVTNSPSGGGGGAGAFLSGTSGILTISNTLFYCCCFLSVSRMETKILIGSGRNFLRMLAVPWMDIS